MAFDYAVVLTGGIATGKSSVAKIFESFDFKIIDADRVAHEMLELHQDKIVELFGSQYILDGKVNRKALGTLIFGNKQEKLRLETLLHPLIFSEIEKQALELDLLKKPYLVDIPLFFETKRYAIEKVIVVYVPRKLQLKRLMARDSSTKEASEQRINSQIEIDKKKQQSTYLIDNQGDLKTLQQHCVKVKDKILDDFRGR